jgi:hypothetical protein
LRDCETNKPRRDPPSAAWWQHPVRLLRGRQFNREVHFLVAVHGNFLADALAATMRLLVESGDGVFARQPLMVKLPSLSPA